MPGPAPPLPSCLRVTPPRPRASQRLAWSRLLPPCSRSCAHRSCHNQKAQRHQPPSTDFIHIALFVCLHDFIGILGRRASQVSSSNKALHAAIVAAHTQRMLPVPPVAPTPPTHLLTVSSTTMLLRSISLPAASRLEVSAAPCLPSVYALHTKSSSSVLYPPCAPPRVRLAGATQAKQSGLSRVARGHHQCLEALIPLACASQSIEPSSVVGPPPAPPSASSQVCAFVLSAFTHVVSSRISGSPKCLSSTAIQNVRLPPRGWSAGL